MTMSPPQAADRVRRLIVEAVHVDVPTIDADLIERGALDSLALVELIFQLEQEFSISIPLDDIDIDQFRSIRSISEFVVALIEAAGEELA